MKIKIKETLNQKKWIRYIEVEKNQEKDALLSCIEEAICLYPNIYPIIKKNKHIEFSSINKKDKFEIEVI